MPEQCNRSPYAAVSLKSCLLYNKNLGLWISTGFHHFIRFLSISSVNFFECVPEMEDNLRGEFYPTKVIVLSELPTREKEKYYQLLAYSNSKFRKDSEGRYVANV